MSTKKHGINLVRIDTTDSDKRKKLLLILTGSVVVLLMVVVVNMGVFGYTVILGQKLAGLDQGIKKSKTEINALSKIESLQTVLVSQVKATGELVEDRGDMVTPLEILLATLNGRADEVLVSNVSVDKDQTMSFTTMVKNSKSLERLLNELVERLVTAGYEEAEIGGMSESVDGAFNVNVSYAK